MLPLLRYTLDLFNDAAPVIAKPLQQSSPNQPNAPGRPGRPKAPDQHRVSRRQKAGSNELTLPDPDAADLLLPLNSSSSSAHEFVHPRANRQSRIAGVTVAYEFTRARRRTIGFVVGPDGLVVRAPRWTPLYEVEAALQEKGRWVLRKLQETRELSLKREQARIEWCDGVRFPYLGDTVVVRLDPTHAFGRSGAELSDTQLGGEKILRVGLPSHATQAQIRDVVQAWLMQQARRLFMERLDHFAPQLGVRWSRLSLSSANTRWGSASANGSIRLNWRLIHFRLAVIDYVVAHELSHLRVMDHSPRFWDTVATVVPDYTVLRRQLKDDTVPRW